MALMACSALMLSGCGSGEVQYRLEGAVTYKGQPVPEGNIVFEPDSSKGNKGPPGRARIQNGRYDTGATGAQGVIGGPHRVSITGFDGPISGAEGNKEVRLPLQLFPPYTVEADLPEQDGTQDFDVKSP